MSLLAEIVSGLFLLSGAAFVVIGCVGLVRMPDLYTRMHAASVTDTLGAGLILAGLLLQAGPTLNAAKLVMVGLLIFFASPTATHALARAAFMREPVPEGAPAEDTQSTR